MKTSFFGWVAASLLVVGCGGNTIVETSGSGGSGGSGTTTGTAGAGGSGGTVQPGCVSIPNMAAPNAVTFQFVNESQSPVYLYEDCFINFTLTHCADDYTEPLVISGFCTADCSEGGCVECGACPEFGQMVAQGSPAEASWGGALFTFAQDPQGCQCHTSTPAPSGNYRISVPVYASEQDALSGNPATTISVDFELPAPNGVVVVPVALLGD